MSSAKRHTRRFSVSFRPRAPWSGYAATWHRPRSPSEHATEEPLISTPASWRPPAFIRVTTFGLPWNGNTFLSAEITRDDGTPVGVRPLGGA